MKKFVARMKKKHESSDPYEIAKQMRIIVLFEELGSINGYFNTVSRHRFIHINQDLAEADQIFTAAHELGHAILHPKVNTTFLRAKTMFSVNKYETEANQFAVHLLISDDDLSDYLHLSISQIASFFGLHEKKKKIRLQGERQLVF